MIFTERIQQAIDVATEAHKGQTRKGKSTPYITHLLSVAIILARVGASEDVIIAGILHDAEEDTSLKKDKIEKLFGLEVARMVDDVSEQDKSLSWETRKGQALEHIPLMGRNSLLLKSADLLHNLTEQSFDQKVVGDNLHIKFNAPKEKRYAHYRNLIQALETNWPDNPLLVDIKAVFENLDGDNFKQVSLTA